MENLIHKIRSYSFLNEKDLQYTLGFYKKVNVPKGGFLIQAGQLVNHYYYLDKGCVYYYQLIDGAVKVMEFFVEDDFFTDLYAYLENIPSNSYIAAAEDTSLYAINKNDVQRSFDRSHELERIGRLSMQEAFIKTFRRTAHLNNLSNEERYLRLLEKRPDLFQRVPQYLIASYLGLTPVGLSKIRKRLATI